MSSNSPTDPAQDTPVYTETLAETPTSKATDALYSPASTDQSPAQPPQSEAASTAKDAAQSAVSTSKDQAKQVASEAKSQARELLHTTTTELRDQATTQQKRVAEGLRSLSEEFGSMADGSESGVAGELVKNLSTRSGDIATWLDERDPGSLINEVKSFAARRPGAFIAIAAGAGVVAGRLAKSLAASAADDSES